MEYDIIIKDVQFFKYENYFFFSKDILSKNCDKRNIETDYIFVKELVNIKFKDK